MEKEEGAQPMSQQQFQAMTQQLRLNKLDLIRILEQNPKVGAYQGETHDDWDHFYTFFINFLRSEIGPRGECAKLIRSQLLQIQQEINDVLQPFGQTAHTHIREIYMKHKFFVPCEEYPQMLKFQEALIKLKSNLDRLSDPQSPMRKQITEGLVAKHGQQYEFQKQFAKLQSNYVIKIEETEKQIARLHEIVQKCQQYHEYMRVKEKMEPYFKLWLEADSNMGKENLKTGQQFQEVVQREVIPYLLAREQNDAQWPYSSKKFEVFVNCSWIPKNLGEIDIAFGYKDEVEDRYFIFTLIECKSRLFDLREAYRQVSLDDQEPLNKGPTLQELKEMKRLKQLSSKSKKQKADKGVKEVKQQPVSKEQKEDKNETAQNGSQVPREKDKKKGKDVVVNKKFLSTKYGPAELVDNHHFYIITTLPQNDFILPIESKMKQAIEKYSKNKFIEDMQSEPLYLSLRQVFANVSSPLQWIKNYEMAFGERESNILVLR